MWMVYVDSAPPISDSSLWSCVDRCAGECLALKVRAHSDSMTKQPRNCECHLSRAHALSTCVTEIS